LFFFFLARGIPLAKREKENGRANRARKKRSTSGEGVGGGEERKKII